MKRFTKLFEEAISTKYIQEKVKKIIVLVNRNFQMSSIN